MADEIIGHMREKILIPDMVENVIGEGRLQRSTPLQTG